MRPTSVVLAALDHTGTILRAALSDAGALPPGFATPTPPATETLQRSFSTPLGVSLARLDEQDEAEADDDGLLTPPQASGMQRSSSMPGTAQAEQPQQGFTGLGLGLGSLFARMGMRSSPSGTTFGLERSGSSDSDETQRAGSV
jgi:hypothetical protein